MVEAPRPRRIAFGRDELMDQLEAFALRWIGARADAAGREFASADGAGRLVLPLCAPRPLPGELVGDYIARLVLREEATAMVLLRAGAVALGWWHGDELLDHKAIRKYVVRGNGKAQPTHLKTRGKSRYGSRLRLQNWKSLLADTNERLHDWWRVHGRPDRVYHAAPVRVWTDLLQATPPPPFAADDATLFRIPLHVHRPDFEELLRVRGWLCTGVVEVPAE